MNYIDIGKKEGGRVITGGRASDKGAYYVEPTIFADVTEDMTIAREEIFGPVIAVSKFKTIDEVCDICNDSIYGLAAGINTTSLKNALQTTEKLRAGQVYVNAFPKLEMTIPFGGIR